MPVEARELLSATAARAAVRADPAYAGASAEGRELAAGLIPAADQPDSVRGLWDDWFGARSPNLAVLTLRLRRAVVALTAQTALLAAGSASGVALRFDARGRSFGLSVPGGRTASALETALLAAFDAGAAMASNRFRRQVGLLRVGLLASVVAALPLAGGLG